MGDRAADASRRRLLRGFGATAALTWSAPRLSPYRAVTSVGTPAPTTEPPPTSPSTTQPPAPRAVRGTASGTTTGAPLDYVATGTFALRVLHRGTYTVNSHWTPLNSSPPFQIAVEGTFRLEPSSGGALYGYMRGTEIWDGKPVDGVFTATWDLEVQGGLGDFRSAQGVLHWQGTRRGDLAGSTDEFTVSGSLRLP